MTWLSTCISLGSLWLDLDANGGSGGISYSWLSLNPRTLSVPAWDVGWEEVFVGLPSFLWLLDKEPRERAERTDPMTDSGDHPWNMGLSVGRQAPTTAMQVSGIVQYIVGARISYEYQNTGYVDKGRFGLDLH